MGAGTGKSGSGAFFASSLCVQTGRHCFKKIKQLSGKDKRFRKGVDYDALQVLFVIARQSNRLPERLLQLGELTPVIAHFLCAGKRRKEEILAALKDVGNHANRPLAAQGLADERTQIAVFLRFPDQLFHGRAVGFAQDGLAGDPDPAGPEDLHQLEHVPPGAVSFAGADGPFQECAALQQLRGDRVIRDGVFHAAIRPEDLLDPLIREQERFAPGIE